ncbi:MAG: hypothetical protein PHF60_03835 [Candidatus ainarchaeum sp.]|nr:hypothetical protein [Candidatus ainarchaeum sp.]
MGVELAATCKECSAKFRIMEGGGEAFTILRCDKCGKEKYMHLIKLNLRRADIKTIEKAAGKCDCGGRNTSDAPPRCPSCKSKNLDISNKIMSYFD